MDWIFEIVMSWLFEVIGKMSLIEVNEVVLLENFFLILSIEKVWISLLWRGVDFENVLGSVFFDFVWFISFLI